MQIDQIEYDHNVHSQPRAGDEKLAIRFFKKAKPNPEKTAKEGRPIFEEADFITIMVPGDRTSIITRPVGEGDAQRFRRQYENWKANNVSEGLIGTPLEAWGVLNLAQVEEFRYFGIRTVEHMASLRDDIAGKIMGATTLKQKAQAFIDASKADAPMKEIAAQLETRDHEIEALKKAIADQAKIIEKLQAAE